jgi:hypothetical protein
MRNSLLSYIAAYRAQRSGTMATTTTTTTSTPPSGAGNKLSSLPQELIEHIFSYVRKASALMAAQLNANAYNTGGRQARSRPTMQS